MSNNRIKIKLDDLIEVEVESDGLSHCCGNCVMRDDKTDIPKTDRLVCSKCKHAPESLWGSEYTIERCLNLQGTCNFKPKSGGK